MNIPKPASILLLSFCISALLFGEDRFSKGDHFAPVNGIKIHYFVSGNGPVCLVPTPGWGPSIDYLKNSLKPFEKYFTVVYYDTRITGQSTGPDDPAQYTSQDFMNDMDSLRVYLNQQKIWIMGHSSGGFQVLNYGIHHCDKLNGIIALDAMAGHDSLRSAEFEKMIMKRKGQPYFEAGSKILLGKDTTNRSRTERRQLTIPFYFHDPQKIAELQKLGILAGMSGKASEYSEASKFGLEYLFPELNKITVPALVVVGDDDFICDKISQADRIAKNIKNSTEIVIKDAGHFCWVEQPVQFFNDCESWLKKQGLREQN
jgi:pimeloyl-ACP methyl ester carboxylesterase